MADLSGDGLPDLLRSWRPTTASTSVATEWAWRLNRLGTTGSLGFPGYTVLGFRSSVDHAGFIADLDGDGASEVLLRKPDMMTSTQSRSPDGFAGYYSLSREGVCGKSSRKGRGCQGGAPRWKGRGRGCFSGAA